MQANVAWTPKSCPWVHSANYSKTWTKAEGALKFSALKQSTFKQLNLGLTGLPDNAIARTSKNSFSNLGLRTSLGLVFFWWCFCLALVGFVCLADFNLRVCYLVCLFLVICLRFVCFLIPYWRTALPKIGKKNVVSSTEGKKSLGNMLNKPDHY